MALDVIGVRQATADDVPAMAAIWLENAEINAQMDARYRIAPNGIDSWTAALLDKLSDNDTCVWVAVRRGKIMGYLLGSVAPNTPGLLPERLGHIDEMAIDSHGHGGGPGTRLLDAVSAWFRERGVTRIEVRVPVSSAIAQAFWRAAGAAGWYDLMWIKLRD